MNEINPYQKILDRSKNNPCLKIPMIIETQRSFRFTKWGGIEIAIDEEREAYELTRFVMFEKTKKPEEFELKLSDILNYMMVVYDNEAYTKQVTY